MPAPILVTGGCGFIGSNYVRYLLETDPAAQVVNFDKLTYAGNLRNLADLSGHPRYRFVRGDITDRQAVREVLREGVSAVVNFAAESVVADTFIPVHRGHGIQLLTAEELFSECARKHPVGIDPKGVEVSQVHFPLFALAFRNGMGQWRRITHVSRHPYQGRVVTLRQKWGSITVTPNHSVYDADARLVAAETNPELLAVRKLNVDRSRHRRYLRVCLPGIKSVNQLLYAPTADGRSRARDQFVRQLFHGPSLAALLRFLGAYAAEGNASFNKANGGWEVCIANQDLNTLKRLRREATLFTNAKGSITLRDAPHAHQLAYSSRILYLLVTHLCGSRAHEKRVPDALYTLTDDFKKAFLDSYLWGDGNVQLYKTVETPRLTTTSPRLAAGLGLLLSLLGRDYSMSYRDFEGHERWRPAYGLNLVSSYDTRAERDYGEQEYQGYVYDLTVEGAHNFAAGIGNIVVHNTHVDRSIHDASPFVLTNVLGTQVLLDAAREFRVARVVQVSSDEVYGSLGPTGYFTEDTPLAPNSPYAASKAAADLLVRGYVHTFGLPALITRCSNNYGPYQFPEKLIPLFITNLLRNEPVPVYGDGLNVRDWIHVRDHCTAIDLVRRRGRPGEVYNVGGRCERTNLELTHTLLDILGKPPTLIRNVTDRPGHDRRYAIDCARIERELGWRPTVSFEQGLRATVVWYQENADWVAGVRSGEYRTYYERQYGRLA
ncbi:MAG: GDP-mannose 4,6-dehydratase [Gemmataceae bacterium]|nr:GDP-mannose 4,6-dehydratase [Gemmataceae bacterium]